jgi:hypothetical protein
MLLEPEDKVLVVHRRLFEGDHQRFFVGIVENYEEGIAKVSGFRSSETKFPERHSASESLAPN